MYDANLTLILAATSLAGLGMLIAASLTGWRGWLALKHQELVLSGPDRVDQPTGHTGSAGARIEMADLKERIRKLEAIAAGVEL